METTVIGYATSRPRRDLVVAARQQITRDWFAGQAQAFELFVSQLVIREASAGDESVACERLGLIADTPLLAVTDSAGELASRLVEEGTLPQSAAEDALHIAIAAVHGIDFLITWNCRHIANAALRPAIERVCREAGYEPPVICTPEELTNDDNG